MKSTELGSFLKLGGFIQNWIFDTYVTEALVILLAANWEPLPYPNTTCSPPLKGLSS